MNYLRFAIQNQVYAINLNDIDEVLMMAAIKPVVGAPEFMQGVFCLRGVLMPVVDFMQQLGLTRRVDHQDISLSQFTTDTRLLVTHINKDHKIVLLVDGWSGLLELDDDTIQAGVINQEGMPDFISDTVQYENELLQIISIKQILNQQQLALLQAAA